MPPGVPQIPSAGGFYGQGRRGPVGYQGQIPAPGLNALNVTYYPLAPTASAPPDFNQFYYPAQGVAPNQQPPPHATASLATLPSQPRPPANRNIPLQRGLPPPRVSIVDTLTKGEIRIALDNIKRSKLAPQVAAAQRSLLKKRLAELEAE